MTVAVAVGITGDETISISLHAARAIVQFAGDCFLAVGPRSSFSFSTCMSDALFVGICLHVCPYRAYHEFSYEVIDRLVTLQRTTISCKQP